MKKIKSMGCKTAVCAYLVVTSCHADSSVGAIDLTMTGDASYSCRLKTSSITFDFTSMSVGTPVSKAVPLDINCPGGASLSVAFSVNWNDGGGMTGGTYTFGDNKDSVRTQLCYAGTSRCWDSPTYFAVTSLPVDLRLTYSSAAAGAKERNGQLIVSYN